MSEPGLLRGALLLALALGAGALAAESPAALLAASDLFAAAPEELRLELEVGAEGSAARVPLEIWRRGRERALVRFLAPAERGKFVLRLGADTWFVAPGASRPVKLGAAFRLQGGAALDELLGLALERDYRIAASHESSGVVTFDLEAVAPTAAWPRLRWAVDAARRRPLRAELKTAQGKTMRVIEFRAWLDEKKLVPGEVAIADLARGGKLVATFRAFEPRAVPEALFSLTDGAARAALAVPAGPG